MKFKFVLKGDGHNRGWWLKVSTVDELIEYYKEVAPSRNGKVFENYLYGKEWNWAHPSTPNDSHCPHYKLAGLTDAIVRNGAEKGLPIYQSIMDFQGQVATNQLNDIQEYGAIYINRMGGYHHYYNDKEHAFVYRDKIIFPDFKKSEIKVSKFPYGSHYYAHIGDLEVRDGDTIKWNTYEEAYNMALKMLESD